jgi:phage-related protein
MNSEVLVKFLGDTKDLDSKTKTASSTLKSFASGVGKAFAVGTTAITVMAGAVVDLTKKSVEGYAEFEQLEGGLESLFGKGSKEMQQIMSDSEEAYKNLTMSQNQYLTSFESAYPIVNAGLSENADSIEYTNKMLQLSSDLFNTYGGSTEYYQNAINWALKGSFVYLDNLNLGIKGTQEGFLEAANNSGILGREIKNVSELSSDEIIDVIQHYAEAYGVWGKTGQEASTTIIGSLNMVKATWSNLITGLAKGDADIGKLIDNLINSALTFADNIMPVITRAVQGIANALPDLITKIADLLPGLIDSLLPPIITAAVNLVKSIVKSLPALLKTLIDAVVQALDGIIDILPDIIGALLDGAIAIIDALAQALPKLLPKLITAIVKGITKIVEYIPQILKAGIQLFMGLIKALPTIIKALIDALPELITSFINALIEYYPALIEGAIELFMALVKALPEIIIALVKAIPQIIVAIVSALIEGVPKLLEAGKNLLSKIKDGIMSGLSAIWNVGKDLVMGLWNGIGDHVNWIVNKVKGFGKSVLKAIKGIFGVHSPSTEFEWIGRMNILGLEQGMENMKTQVQDTIDGLFNLQPGISGSMNSSYSPQIAVNVQNNMEIDPLGQVVNKIKTFSGGAKNDYNWGAGL